MSVTKPALPKDPGAVAFGVQGGERPSVPAIDHDPASTIATKLAAYIAAAVLIGSGYHLWQEVEANLHVFALWSSLACYVLGFAIAWYGSLNGVSSRRRENAAVVGLVAAFLLYAISYTLFRATTYGTDAMLFNAYSAELLTHGVNPYAANMQPAFGLFGVPTNLVTPTENGGVVFVQSYPALSFLIYVPFAVLGINALWLSVASHVALVLVLVFIAPRPFKALAPVILFADPAYAQYTLGSVTDIIWALPAVLCAYYWRSKPTLAAFYLGLACGLKQSPWFIVPFAMVAWSFTAVESRRWSSFFEPFSVLALTFLLPNAPFIAWDPGMWARGVMTPMAGNLIAFGSGIVQLTTANVYATDLHTLTTLSAAVLGLLLVVYAFDRRRFGFVPFLAPGIALFFAARSLQNYFMFWPIALVAFALSKPADVRLRAAGLERSRAPWAPIAVGALATLLIGFLIVRSTTAAASSLRVSILRYGYDEATNNVNSFNIRLTNADKAHTHSVRFGILMQGAGDDFVYWVRRPVQISPKAQNEIRIAAPDVRAEVAPLDRTVQIVAIDADAGTQSYSAPIDIEPPAAGLANPHLASWMPGRPSIPLGWNYSANDFRAGDIRRSGPLKHSVLTFTVAPPKNDEWHVASISQKLPGELRRFTVLLRPYQNYQGNAYPRQIFGVEMIDALGHHAYYTVDSSVLHSEIFKHDQFTVFEVPGRIGAWNKVEVDPEQLQHEAGFMLSATSQVEINVIAGQHRDERGIVRGDFGESIPIERRRVRRDPVATLRLRQMERLDTEPQTSEGSGARAAPGPVFVDLDGTLVRTDLLFETFLSAVKRRPWVLLVLPFWLVRGRAYAKRKLAERGPVRVDLLPYDPVVVSFLSSERDAGRRLILATAADATVAHGVATHLGLFDDVIASDGTRNLKSRAKLTAIRELCEGPFDYVGNATADVPIWSAAGRAIAVRAQRVVLRRVEKAGVTVAILAHPPNPFPALLRALRPHQWAKNALIFLPLLASHIYTDVSLFAADAIAFVAFSFCASSVYILNDLLDLDSDREHPRKRLRPFAAGELPIPLGLAATLVLLAASVALAWFVGPNLLAVLEIYFVVTLSYSLRLKAIVLVDTIVLAGLYTIRVIAGFAATSLVPSFWLLAFALFLFFGLAMMKRFSELIDARKRNVVAPPGRGYRADDLDVVGIFGAVTGCLSILILAFYINTADVTRLYGHPARLWGIVPVLLYWVSKVWLIAHRGEMNEDPVVYALTDRESLLVFLICVGIATLATF